MQRKEHKRKTNHVVIVTSDAVDANVKQFRIRPWILQVIILVLCVVIGILIAYFTHEEKIWQVVSERSAQQQDTLHQLEEEKGQLEAKIDELNATIQILSDTVNQKVQSESELAAVIEKQSTPSEFPLTGSASMEEATEGDPMCIFTASAGTTVVATASGNVIAINEDETYGNNVWIDHGNGYVTIYRNKGDVNVKIGDDVVQGTTIFLIGEDNGVLGYQMMKDGSYINPMEMLEING